VCDGGYDLFDKTSAAGRSQPGNQFLGTTVDFGFAIAASGILHHDAACKGDNEFQRAGRLQRVVSQLQELVGGQVAKLAAPAVAKRSALGPSTPARIALERSAEIRRNVPSQDVLGRQPVRPLFSRNRDAAFARIGLKNCGLDRGVAEDHGGYGDRKD
jgi:hypothetical protein